jgi:L-idonate 5-dehydrogenase
LAAAADHGLEVARAPEEAKAWAAARGDRGGVDLVVDTTGAASAIALAAALMRRRGRLLALGFGGSETIAVPWDALLQRAATVSFGMSSSHTGWLAATELLAARHVVPQWLVTSFDLPDWSTAFEAARHRNVIKAVLRP